MTLAYVVTFVLALLGLLLFFAGVRRLWGRRFLMGSAQGLLGLLLLSVGILVLLVGMNLYTYQRFTLEKPVATVSFEQISPQHYRVNLAPVGETPRLLRLNGDEWQLDVRLIKWQGLATLIGVDPVYRLDRFSGRYRSTDQELHEVRTIYDLGVDHGMDLWAIASRHKSWLPWVDALYGSAVYMPMADQASYQVSIAASGLVVRPDNTPALQAVKAWQ
ncbi:MAG: cation/multidrug efflux pump [Gammaproteobacteria bacterium]|nr:cation/multidrug efflux pump [Gammaproteobacteria bacterium]